MIHPATLPGFLAVLAEQRVPELDKTESASWLPTGPVRLCRWGAVADADGAMMVVSKAARTAEGNMPRGKIAELMAADPAALTPLLPPFGAVAVHDQQAVMVADSMGFQHMFLTSPISDLPPALSNSSLTLGRTTGAAIDLKGVAVQSLLGWQLGQRTLFAGIEKLAPGAVVRLTGAGVGISEPTRCHIRDMSLQVAVQRTAAILRRSLTALIDEHPDAVLQLTGGMDSRLLLSAIPESRRRGLRAMTLEVPGSDDVAIARAIARRYGIRHDVHGLAEVGTLSPAEAWDLCVADAVRLDAMSDPVALAAQRVAERAFDQGVRISGLGGEIARGFYYFGRVRDRTYTRNDSKRLASWRMCVNDAVEPELFTTDFSAWSREITYEEVHNALLGGGSEWFRATDHLYVRHRMQRWAGATDGAVSDQRTVVNPMLDDGFLDIVARLPPAKKTRSKFLAALQLELDPELGRLPLDGRPAPEFYAHPPAWRPVLSGITLSERIVSKAAQRLKRSSRPPAGGAVLATKVVDHWRAQPSLLEPLNSLSFLRKQWLDQVVSGRVEPRASSVALLTNLVTLTSFGLGSAL